MKLVLCNSSALDLIRVIRWRGGEFKTAQLKTLEDCANSMREIERIAIPAFDQTDDQLEVLVHAPAKAQKSKHHVCRVLTVQPVHGMFCKVADDAYITSPEMTFVQMANRLPLLDLVLLGMELCGTYARCPGSDRFDERPPVTSTARIEAFCRRAQGVKGAASALKAAKWLVNGSNSPAETALVLFLCLPVRLGGYGFKFPDMNPTTPLGERASRMLGHPTMRCDLHWVAEAVVVEYDSDQEHLSSRSASKDALRRNVLGYKGITVLTVRNPMIVAPKSFDDVVKQLAKALGRRLRPRDLEFTSARADLRMRLFPWLQVGWR